MNSVYEIIKKQLHPSFYHNISINPVVSIGGIIVIGIQCAVISYCNPSIVCTYHLMVCIHHSIGYYEGHSFYGTLSDLMFISMINVLLLWSESGFTFGWLTMFWLEVYRWQSDCWREWLMMETGANLYTFRKLSPFYKYRNQTESQKSKIFSDASINFRENKF